ncbi:glutathione peroxidase [Pseudobacteriovorax antillogorgiicola]|uniref:Glutathione peroxidase n=1 Tax=Pseudobacteriovorax antillogorgiicola TaxID=1513793 RepID=A0A1Y6C923_9BACT|nr:glutathione peroxidase [Pseudobacteriovorax antillogorgiicola]TCS51806.1 glutathione peroxidase [Pseudobacteriovorax antillogorgiicola]SMF50138.1 glutathione peroxidase [Pseudobacteriovorax antillogorgiicola]
MPNIYDFSAETITGEQQPLSAFKGQAMLIVNVASACGLTPHYEGLQSLYSEYKDQGFTVLGFPCNQFGAQEPGSHEEIKSFCETKFGVSFPMFAKIDVNGDQAHPLYKFLKNEKKGNEGDDIEWNFAKFLINKEGEVVERFHPKVEPKDIKPSINSLL